MAWGKAGSTTLSSTASPVTVSGFGASTFIQELHHGIESGAYGSSLRFNNDSGTKYANGRSANGAAKNNGANRTFIENVYGDDTLMISYIVDIASEEKLLINSGVFAGTDGAGNAPNRLQLVGKYVPSPTARITQVNRFDSEGGAHGIGTNLTVLGSDMTPAAATAAIPAIDDVQDGSLFVEKDTTRRYWFDANPLVDDFSVNDYSSHNTDWGVSNGTLNGRVTDNSHGAWKNYGELSDTAWVVRFKYELTAYSGFSGNGSQVIVVMTDTDGGSDPVSNSQKAIGFWITNQADCKFNFIAQTSGNLTSHNDTFSTDPEHAPRTYYIEMKRTSATSATITMFNNSDYTGVYGTKTVTISSSLTGLKYFMLAGWNNSSSNNTTLAIDNLEIWNGVATASGGGEWKFQLSLADLKAYWKMGEIGGNLINHATSIGSKSAMSADLVSSGTVNRGTAGHVSGVDSIGFPTYDADGNKVTANNSASDYGFMNKAAAKFTACWWAKNESHNSTVDLWGFGGNGGGTDIQFRNKSSGFTIWFSGTEYTSFTHNVGDNNWHFYMLSWDEDGGSDNAQFQLDGTKQTATITTSNTSNSDSPLTIGDVSGNEPEMDIQEFSLWNRILSDVEIAHIYNAGAGRQL